MTGFLLAVFVGGLIGWLTNLLAIKALFRPRTPKGFWGLTIQGVLPKRKKDLARNLGEVVEDNLLKPADLINTINSADFEPLVDGAVKDFVREYEEKIPRDRPYLAAVFKPLLGFAGDAVAGMIRKRLPGFLEKGAKMVTEKVSVRAIVREKVEEMDLDKLEKLVYSISERELKVIEWLGGVLGMFMGGLQWFLQTTFNLV